MSTIAAARPTPGIARWGALGGILYVVLFIVGTILLYGDSPDSSSAPAKIVAYYSDSGNRDKISAGWIVGGLGVFFFLWFLGALRGAVRRWEGADGYLTAMTTIGGVVYGTLALAALAINMGIRTMSDDTFQHTVYPELLHAADDASYILHASGGAGASAMIIAASLAAQRAGVIRAWAMWLGIAAGIIALASVLFFTQAAIALWILVVSGLLFARGRAEPTGAV